MWHIVENGELVPLALVNAKAKCEELLEGHNVGHPDMKWPFCEGYGCSSIVEILDALTEKGITK